MKKSKILAVVLSLILLVSVVAPMSAAAYDGADRIYTIATAHLDTVWQWTLETTIGSYIPKTFNTNFDFIERYSDYNFNFEGAYRYALIEEYYPEAYEQLKQYIAAGRWNVSGSAWENGDVNVPSPEALFRNILYGNGYFDENFEKRSVDIYLPDCFGFGYALPSIERHANLIGFSTQKLEGWGSAYIDPTGQGRTVPFDLGRWYGVDGSYIYAGIKMKSYGGSFGAADTGTGAQRQPRINTDIISKLADAKTFGFNFAAKYHGTGDTGGAPSESSVSAVSNAVAANALYDESNPNDSWVLSATTDQVFIDMDQILSNTQKNNLPNYSGELTMQNHGVGGYTSRAMQKRLNRRNEVLADATERAAVAASWLGAMTYPQAKMDEVWKNVIAHQFHDDMPGTSLPSVYKRSWNEYFVDLNMLAGEYEAAVRGVSRALNTNSVVGVPVVVKNDVEASRTESVEAEVTMPEGTTAVRVYDAAGNETASQIVSSEGNTFNIVFVAAVPSLGYAVYDVRPTEAPCAMDTGLSVSETGMVSNRYNATIDENGNISSILDKLNGDREMLTKPIRYTLINSPGSSSWPSWELVPAHIMDPTRWSDIEQVDDIEVIENGPARVSVKVTRTVTTEVGNATYEGTSYYTTIMSLDATGNVIKYENEVDWASKRRVLKTSFSFNSANEKATFDLGLGSMQRGNAVTKMYEVPAQRWADLTATDGSYGVSVLSQEKVGWDKPADVGDDTLRLTALYTPQYTYVQTKQDTQEIGLNRWSFAVYGHANGYQNGTNIEADKYIMPLTAFQTTKHAGDLGTSYSFGSISTNNIAIRAIKKAQNSDEIVIRVNEIAGTTQVNAEISLGNGIISAREIYASEEAIGSASVISGKLRFSIGAFGVKSFAVRLASSAVTLSEYASQSIDLPYNQDVISYDSNRADGAMLRNGETLPAEMIPDVITAGGVDFTMGNKSDGKDNAVFADGQTIQTPAGYNTLYLLATSTLGSDRTVDLKVDGETLPLDIHDYKDNFGAWDLITLELEGYVKKADIGAFITHRHAPERNIIGGSTYLFKYAIDIDPAGSEVKLPFDPYFIIMSATVVNETDKTECVTDLYDQRERESYGEEWKPARTDFSQTFEGAETDAVIPAGWSYPQVTASSTSNVTVGISNLQAHSGNYSLRFAGDKTGTGGGVSYRTMADVNIPVDYRTDYVLSFWFKPMNELSQKIGMELYMSTSGNSNYTRDSGFVDQNGLGIHSSNVRGVVGEWRYFEINFGELKGQSIRRIVFSIDASNTQPGPFEAYFDDVYLGIPHREPDMRELDFMVDYAEGKRTLMTVDSFADTAALIEEGNAIQDDPTAYSPADSTRVIDEMLGAFKQFEYRDIYQGMSYDDEKVYETGELIALQVTTRSDVRSIKLLNEKGAVIGVPYQVIDFDEDGNLIWNLWFTMGSVGERTITVLVDGVNYGETMDVKVGPPMSKLTLTLDSVSGPKTANVNESFQVTVVTSKDVTKIGLFNEKDAKIGFTYTTQIDGDKKIWTVNTSIGTKGIRAITVKAAGPDGVWIGTTKTLAIIVNQLPPAV